MKGKEWMERNLPLVLVGFTIVALIVVIRSFQLPSTGRQVVAGCVLIGSKSNNGWNKSHYNALSNACKSHGCPLLYRDGVREDKAALTEAVRSLVDEGCNVIYLTSFGYGQYADDIARLYPQVAFFCISGKGEAQNCTSYFARLYQVRYLAGLIAGAESKTGILGFVASMPNAQTNRGINAYARGMRLANPNARLIVRFTGSWDDEQTERESVALLKLAGADVITYHEDQPHALKEAEALGLMSTGYDTIYEKYSDKFLTAALYDWDILYEKILGDYISGRANFSSRHWLGLAENAVKLSPLSPAVSERTTFLATQEYHRLLNGRSVFSGIIYDNKGTLRCESGERISDYELFNGMDWFIEGVEIYE